MTSVFAFWGVVINIVLIKGATSAARSQVLIDCGLFVT